MSEDKKLQKEEVKENLTVENEVTGNNDSDKKSINDSAVKENKVGILKNNKFKTLIISVGVGALCLGIGYASGKEVGRGLPATSKSYSSSKVMATVGEHKITGEDLAYRMEPLFYLNGKEAMSEDQITAYEQSMLDYMTTTEILYLEGKAENIEVTKEEIQAEYDNLMASIESTFKMTKDEYIKQFKTSEEYIKADLEKELIATKYIGQASDVSDTEAKNYYDKNKDEFLQIRASHILIQNRDDEGKEVSEEQKKANKEKAQGILDKIKAGEDFATLAKEYSQDSSAEKGGDLDFFGKGQMVEPFEKATFALKVGEVSPELVETDYGYHIIKKTDEQFEEYDDIKEDLKKDLSYEKQNNLITDLFEKYNVDVKEKY